MNAKKSAKSSSCGICFASCSGKGRPTTAVRKQIEKALAEREEAA